MRVSLEEGGVQLAQKALAVSYVFNKYEPPNEPAGNMTVCLSLGAPNPISWILPSDEQSSHRNQRGTAKYSR